MAEYKYRALGWQDDDIASLNVVDGTAADNQVELQITKQGEGGKISGPAIVGKDGITIDKAADSEKIEISGSGLVQKQPETSSITFYSTKSGSPTWRAASSPMAYAAVLFTADGQVLGNMGSNPAGNVLTNRKYVDDAVAAGGTSVTPNPTLSGSEAALSALQIGDTKYRIEGSLTTLMVGIDSSLLGG